MKKMSEERDLLVEEFGLMLGTLEFDKLIKYIPRVEKGSRVKVFRQGEKYYPHTKIGIELVLAYKMVGFSFIPVLVEERKENPFSPPPSPYFDLERIEREVLWANERNEGEGEV